MVFETYIVDIIVGLTKVRDKVVIILDLSAVYYVYYILLQDYLVYLFKHDQPHVEKVENLLVFVIRETTRYNVKIRDEVEVHLLVVKVEILERRVLLQLCKIYRIIGLEL